MKSASFSLYNSEKWLRIVGAEMEVDTIKEKISLNETHSYACKVNSGGSWYLSEHTKQKSSQVELYCYSATCVDI